jgi:hypothetical protein
MYPYTFCHKHIVVVSARTARMFVLITHWAGRVLPGQPAGVDCGTIAARVPTVISTLPQRRKCVLSSRKLRPLKS